MIYISPNAEERIGGYEQLMTRICECIESDAYDKNVLIKRIEVWPDWSHEYDASKELLIYVIAEGSEVNRFTLWNGLCNKIEELAENKSLSQDEHDFIMKNISIVVIE